MCDINKLFEYLKTSNISLLSYNNKINNLNICEDIISKLPNCYHIYNIKKWNFKSFARNIKIDNLLYNRDIQIEKKYIIYYINSFCYADIDKIINDNFNATEEDRYSILFVCSSTYYSLKLTEICDLQFNINENSIKIVKNRFGYMFDVNINGLKKYNNENSN